MLKGCKNNKENLIMGGHKKRTSFKYVKKTVTFILFGAIFIFMVASCGFAETDTAFTPIDDSIAFSDATVMSSDDSDISSNSIDVDETEIEEDTETVCWIAETEKQKALALQEYIENSLLELAEAYTENVTGGVESTETGTGSSSSNSSSSSSNSSGSDDSSSGSDDSSSSLGSSSSEEPITVYIDPDTCDHSNAYLIKTEQIEGDWSNSYFTYMCPLCLYTWTEIVIQ